VVRPLIDALADLISDGQVDLPRQVQGAVDALSWVSVPVFADEDERDAAWGDGFRAPWASGLCRMTDTPNALWAWNWDLGKWQKYAPEPEYVRGTATFTWAAGADVSGVVTISFAGQMSAPPPKVEFSRESNPGASARYEAFVIAGSITTAGCQVQALRTPAAPSGGATATLAWDATRRL